MARVVFPPLPPQCQTSVFEASKGVQLRGTIVFLHGWPDTVQMWEPTQERFARLGYRCAAVGLPGYGTGVKKKTGFKFTEVDDILEKAVAHVAQGQRITLVGHDWGAMFSLRLERTRLNQIVDRYVILDVGQGFDVSSLSVLSVLAYQLPLILAFFAGGRLGGALTKFVARAVGAPSPVVDSSLNYFYKEFLSLLLMGNALQVAKRPPPAEHKPLCYMFGAKKPIQFHSQKWLDSVSKRTDGSRVLSIAGGHWFVVSKRTREDFWRHLEDFLRETPTAPAPAPASGSFAAQNYDAPARL